MSEAVVTRRAQQLAEQFEAATSELAAFIESTNAQEWATKGVPAPDTPDWSVGEEDEKRPVRCLAYHIAAVIGIPHTLLVKDAAEGKALDLVHAWTVDNVAEWNAGVAEEQANVTQAEVLQLLQANTAAALDMINGFADEHLERSISSDDDAALLPWCGGAKTVDQLIEHMLIGHIHLHRSSMRAAVGR